MGRAAQMQHATVLIEKIDWSYDFFSYENAKRYPGSREIKVKRINEMVDMLFGIEALVGKCEATIDENIPRVGYGKVLKTGMVAKCPHFWEPRPCVLIETWSGTEWLDWQSISDYRVIR